MQKKVLEGHQVNIKLHDVAFPGIGLRISRKHAFPLFNQWRPDHDREVQIVETVRVASPFLLGGATV